MSLVQCASSSQLVVGISDMKISDDPNQELITYSLGSCLGIAVHDPIAQIGGLLHVLLPSSSILPDKAADLPFTFVDTGVARLFHSLNQAGGERTRLIAKAAGGARMKGASGNLNIGERNLQALVDIFHGNGIPIQAHAIGGHLSRTLRMNVGTGCVTVQSPGHEDLQL